MTIDEERLRAINATREYLMEKIKGRTKLRNRKERVRVFNLLRHYPEEHWVADVGSILLQKNTKKERDEEMRFELRRDIYGDSAVIMVNGVDVIHLVPSELTNRMIGGFITGLNALLTEVSDDGEKTCRITSGEKTK